MNNENNSAPAPLGGVETGGRIPGSDGVPVYTLAQALDVIREYIDKGTITEYAAGQALDVLATQAQPAPSADTGWTREKPNEGGQHYHFREDGGRGRTIVFLSDDGDEVVRFYNGRTDFLGNIRGEFAGPIRAPQGEAPIPTAPGLDRCPHGTDYAMDCDECHNGEPAPTAPAPDVPELIKRAHELVTEAVLSDDGMDGELGLSWIKDAEAIYPALAPEDEKGGDCQ